ncbi:DNA-binding transcriptional regulator [Azohydromonas aeria]|uniref:DNA-binding transcriptional regulator n=1 Tax=Azohydromonas aeria TaxID=2590212 RepID=UPI0012FA9756|nr:DNA-binding transcriptional regulator [Azohydromonas aeria]
MSSTAIDRDEGVYKEVRGLSRGLAVLKALNRLPGGIGNTTELARLCDLDRTTTKRLLETLRAQGFVRQGEKDGQYYLTFEVRRLSEGFEDEAWVARIASPAMQAAVRELVWPCDLGTAEAGFMVVRESTHRWSALSQHRAMIGEKLPMLETAIGRAYLAAADEAEREALLELLRRRTDRLGELARDTAFVQRLIDQTLQRGYAINEGEWLQQSNFAAVAVAVHAGSRLLAALNLVFPKAAVSERDLQQRFVPALQRLADAVGRGSRAWIES